MFEDLADEDVEVSPDAADRTILFAIWAKSDAHPLTPEEGWAVLFERYPDDGRLLLLSAYVELTVPDVSSAWTAGYFLKKVERILATTGDLEPHVRDLMGFAGAQLAGAKGEDLGKRNELRERVGAAADGKRDERAGLRLRRFEREVLRELEARTTGGAPLGTRREPAAAAPPLNDWASLVSAGGERKPYAATSVFVRGDLVEHAKFGVGAVTGTEPGRAHILFESGPRKLVAGS